MRGKKSSPVEEPTKPVLSPAPQSKVTRGARLMAGDIRYGSSHHIRRGNMKNSLRISSLVPALSCITVSIDAHAQNLTPRTPLQK